MGCVMYAELEEFTVAVARFGELRETGLLRAKILPGGAVTLAIDEAAEEVPEPGDGRLFRDIRDVLYALADNVSVEEFIRARCDDADEQETVARKKYEATAAAFPLRYLRPALRHRVRRRARAWIARSLIAIGKRSGRLRRWMTSHRFRQVLGNDGRRSAWNALGAQIADTVRMTAGVWMRNPRQVRVGAGTKLGGRVRIDSYGEVAIGRNVIINDSDLFTTQHDLDNPLFKADIRSISIGDYAWLPRKVIVLPGVRIGSYAVIGTGSVVSHDVPDYGVAVGNPARVVKERARIQYTYVPSNLQRGPLLMRDRI
jgi:acetyltransferase-like isoleucine patch superfamily enzyme